MPKYVIERDPPGAGALNHGERAINEKRNGVLADRGPDYVVPRQGGRDNA